MRPTRVASAALATVILLAPDAAAAQITILERDAVRLDLSGYVRTFTGVHDRGYDIPSIAGAPSLPRESGFHGQVVRLKWLFAGESWRLDVHNRFQARVTSGGSDQPILGFGVSAVPDRSVNLETDLVQQSGLRVWHDLDRLSFSVYTDAADVTVGRQAITWGVSTIFPVADLWARFSPFELDTAEKPGIDAVRALFYPRDGLEMDAVVADRGSIDDLSMGLRGTYGLPSADVWAGAGKFWREVLAMGGLTLLFDETKLRAEAVLPWDLDAGTLDNLRGTLGVDWIRGTLVLSGEYHYNGIGAERVDGYARVLDDPRLARGETYYLGRHYLGALASWSPDEENRLSLAINALANIRDRSFALTPMVNYDFGQASSVSFGALVSTGETPVLDAFPPRLGSEFGTYGRLAFTQLSIYF